MGAEAAVLMDFAPYFVCKLSSSVETFIALFIRRNEIGTGAEFLLFPAPFKLVASGCPSFLQGKIVERRFVGNSVRAIVVRRNDICVITFYRESFVRQRGLRCVPR